MDLLFNLFTEVLISVVRKDHCVCNEDKKAVQKGYLNNFIFSKIYWDTCCFVLNDYCFKPKKNTRHNSKICHSWYRYAFN